MAVVEIHDPVGERAAASHHAGMIVVVDDSEADRAALVRPLEQAGYRVISSDNCDDALQAAHGCPDLILIDVRMLDRSGYTTCARLKADHRCGGAPVILTCSGATSGDDAMRAIEGGADAFLARPIEPIILLSTVKAWVRAHRADRERARLEDGRRAAGPGTGRGQGVPARDGRNHPALARAHRRVPRT